MTMEAEFEKACKDGIIPGVVLFATSKTGKFEYSRTFGTRSIKPGDSHPPLEASNLMRIASATKLVTAVAAMQCVERKMIGLDDDVIPFLPELKDVQILTGYDEEDNPLLTPPKEKITLRRLLSHSSGFAYDVLSPLLVKWREIHNVPTQPSGPKLTDRFLYPLTSQPGTEWIYSPSLDWAGRLVENLTQRKLEDYIAENISKPLGAETFTFYPQQHETMLATHVEMASRVKDSDILEYSDENYWHEDPKDAFGGMALCSGARDFFHLIKSLTLNDGKLLSPESRQTFLAPQHSSAAKASLKEFLSNKEYNELGMGGFFPHDSERDHALAGMHLTEDLPEEQTPRRKGTVAWMGLPNFYWMIDPVSGLGVVYASQVKPPDDKLSHELVRLFEKTMYERLKEAEK